MTLTSKQYEIIQDIYRERRRTAREDALARREQIARALPELAVLDEERRKLSMDRLKASLGGNAEQAEALRGKLEQTDARKKALLASKGYTPEDLEPRYLCPVCHDTGRDGTRDCACFDRLVMERFYSASPLWNRTEEESFDVLSLDWYDNKIALPEFQGRTCRQVMAENVAAARDYVARFGEKKDSLLLTGPVGTGKTFLCNCIAGALLKTGWSVLYVSAQELFDRIEAVGGAADHRRSRHGIHGQKARGERALHGHQRTAPGRSRHGHLHERRHQRAGGKVLRSGRLAPGGQLQDPVFYGAGYPDRQKTFIVP